MDRDLFREIFAALPTTVAVVTALDESGTPRGLTSNTVCAVSRQPPMLLVCVDRQSQTLPALRHSRAFVVNFLAAGAQDVSQVFAGKGEAKFERLRTVAAPRAGGAPILADHVIAYAECVVSELVEAGDHLIVIGRIEAGAVHERAPLMYFRRGYPVWRPEPRLAALSRENR